MPAAPLPIPIPFPIHVVDPAGPPAWVIAVISAAIGFVLAIFAEPLKAYIMELYTAKRVKTMLYQELADCLLDIEETVSFNDTGLMDSLLHNVPAFQAMAWHKVNHFNAVHRADPKRGLMGIEELLARNWKNYGRKLHVAAPEMVSQAGKLGILDGMLFEQLMSAARPERKRRRELIEKSIAKAR